MKMKTIWAWILTLILGALLFGYAIIGSTFLITKSGTKLGAFWFIVLAIVTVYAFARLIIWLLSQFVKMIRGGKSI